MKKKITLLLFTLICVTVPAFSQILVETESFEERGGWVADHQAYSDINSSYLLAHGMGRPVDDAVTTIKVKDKGHYYAYVSTYNWTSPWYDGPGPGSFELIIDGQTLPNTLGCSGERWEWQYAGEIDLAGTTEIRLHDLTGFEGRADAIYLSKENAAPTADYAEMVSIRRELLGCTKTVKPRKADLVVIGAGISGCAAALTAARYGLDVILVDNLPWLGGNNALGVKACGLMYKNLYPNLGNVTCQLIGAKLEDKNNPEAYFSRKNGSGYIKSLEPLEPWGKGNGQESDLLSGFGNLTQEERKAITKEEREQVIKERNRRLISGQREKLLEQAGVRIYKETQVYSVTVKDGKIVAVNGKNLSNSTEYEFSGTLFVDCTGDGAIGMLAGAGHMSGREEKSFAGEPSAPAEKDYKMMGSSMHWYAYPRAESGSFPRVEDIPWAMQCSDEYFVQGSQWQWWWETGLEYDNWTEAELVRDNFFRAVYGNWAYLKNNVPKYASYRLDYLQHIAMKRESNRIIGDIVLTENDIVEKVAYDDASFTATWPLDLHYAVENNAKAFPGWEWIVYNTNEENTWIMSYDVPYRCLYSRDITNMFLGGRNMSVTHQALGTVRVQATLGMAGEVIGMAAKVCKTNKITPRQVYTDRLDELKAYMSKGAPLHPTGKTSNP